MDELTASGAARAVGNASGLILGAEIGKLAAGPIVGVAPGVSLEIAGRLRWERHTR